MLFPRQTGKSDLILFVTERAAGLYRKPCPTCKETGVFQGSDCIVCDGQGWYYADIEEGGL